MARAGYQPVLVYNACPNVTIDGGSLQFISIGNSQLINPPTVVDMSSILTALCATTKVLASLALSAEAPPVFLLDGNRRGLGISYGPGWFDNRSFVTPSDFPSPDYFRRQGISKVILLQPNLDINADLRQVLLRLQPGGMSIATQAPWQTWAPRPLTIKPPMFIVSVWESLRCKLGYRRDSFHASFGGVIPPSSS